MPDVKAAATEPLPHKIDGDYCPACKAEEEKNTPRCNVELDWNGQMGRFFRCILPEGHEGLHIKNDKGKRVT